MNTIKEIVINGQSLNEAQKMTIHVALNDLLMTLNEEEFPLGDDAHGKFMTNSYKRCIHEIFGLYS